MQGIEELLSAIELEIARYSISIESPLSKIAEDIGDKYLRQPFPPTKLSNGLLDRTANLGKKPAAQQTKLFRPIHGYQNGCRVAALIPVFLELYKKHIGEFRPELQESIRNVTSEQIKEFQIVGLIRAAGRTRDDKSGRKFCEQGKLECQAYLKSIGMQDSGHIERLASAIVDCEGQQKQPLSLAALLLADATLIETLRDGLSYADKVIYLDRCPFYTELRDPKKT